MDPVFDIQETFVEGAIGLHCTCCGHVELTELERLKLYVGDAIGCVGCSVVHRIPSLEVLCP